MPENEYRSRLTRDEIFLRMKKDAAHLWGYQEADMDGFDPLVELLMGACAAEVKKIHDEILATQSRVLERVANLLTPDVLTGASPAHGIMHSAPVEPQHQLSKSTQFYYYIKKEDQKLEVSFSPVFEFPIFDVEITHLAQYNQLYSLDGIQRELLGKTVKPLNPSTLYLGVRVNEELENLKGLRFYFDWSIATHAEKQMYFSLLPATRWEIGSQPIDHLHGFDHDEETLRKFKTLEYTYNITNKVEQHALEFYANRFITLSYTSSHINLEKMQTLYPAEFNDAFSSEILSALKDELLWIKVMFPESFPQKAISEALVYANCFPVINRKLKTIPYRLQRKINIIPLESSDHFFDLHSVRNSEGKAYVSHATNHLKSQKPRTYTLRRGGTQRFDPRDASAMLDYLFDLLRDESAAFSALGYDVLSSDIRELNQIITKMERSIKGSTYKEQVNYLIISPDRIGENIEVQYWTTAGAEGNEIATGVEMGVTKGADFKRGSIYLVSKTSGGRDRLSGQDELYAYKEALLNRGRIVSKADIHAKCFTILGDRLRNVEVKEGVMIGTTPGKGLQRTLDVWLEPRKEGDIAEEECRELETILTRLSTGLLPFRIHVK